MSIIVKAPCSEDWSKMKIGLYARYCENCKKNVVDFTKMERGKIIEYLILNRDNGVCGRIFPWQLDFKVDEIAIPIYAQSRKSRNLNLSLYAITLASLMFVGCDEHSMRPKENTLINKAEEQIVCESKAIEEIKNSVVKESADSNDFQIQSMPPLIGLITRDPTMETRDSEPYINVDKMPIFQGGEKGLFTYLRKNIKYPRWEKKNKIEGTVFVKFVVDKHGKTQDAEILRSVEGSKNFDEEVLRVIYKMPLWIPGQKDDKVVDVLLILPVRFTL